MFKSCTFLLYVNFTLIFKNTEEIMVCSLRRVQPRQEDIDHMIR